MLYSIMPTSYLYNTRISLVQSNVSTSSCMVFL
nr:MAG TPA: hypothetical protein [Bacteriophage sp.]